MNLEAKIEESEGLVVVQLLWLSGRALAAQDGGGLGLTPGSCRPFHFPLFSSLVQAASV